MPGAKKEIHKKGRGDGWSWNPTSINIIALQKDKDKCDNSNIFFSNLNNGHWHTHIRNDSSASLSAISAAPCPTTGSDTKDPDHLGRSESTHSTTRHLASDTLCVCKYRSHLTLKEKSKEGRKAPDILYALALYQHRLFYGRCGH